MRRMSVGHDSGCWEWTGRHTVAGYGTLRLNGEVVYVHRLSAEHLGGQDVAGKHVLHRCDNPRCINPDHLFTGTQADNMHDKVAKGRQPRGSLAGGSKLTAADVLEIRRLCGTMPQTRIAERFGICQQTVSDIKRGRRWGHIEDWVPQRLDEENPHG